MALSAARYNEVPAQVARLAISTDYPTPVYVNGFRCNNCTDVDNAKKDIDPAHPKAGPFGVNAKNDPSLQFEAAVKFDGALSGATDAGRGAAAPSATALSTVLGKQVDVSA